MESHADHNSTGNANNAATGVKGKRKADTLTDDVNYGGVGPSLCCPCVHCDHCECHVVRRMTAVELAEATTDATYLDSLPIGYRFKPTDEELITHYLLKKIKNENLPKNKINEADIYGDLHPKDIVVNYPQAIEGEWYFFTSRNRKYVHGKRPSRKAGSGYWKATGPDKVIEHNKIQIGGKKSLVYNEGRPPKGTKTEWMMHEYVVKGYERQRFNLQDMKLDDYVLCKIYAKRENGKEINEQVVSDQQPRVDSNDLDENLTTNLHVENRVTEAREQVLVPYQQARVVSDQDINPTSYYVENNNIVHSNQSSNSTIHHVENSSPSMDRQVMVPDQLAHPTILQVENNVVVQNYQDMGSLYDLITPYSRSLQPVQRTGFPKIRAPPLVHDYSLTQFNNYSLPNNSYFPPTPRRSAPLPPRIVNASHAHPEIYWSGSSSNPPLLAFQKGNDCDPDNLLWQNIENLFSQDEIDGLGDDNYPLPFDRNEQLDFDESKNHDGQH